MARLKWVHEGRFEVLEIRMLLSAGDLDTRFGSGGLMTYDDSGPALAMALQPGGKILVAEANGIIDRFTADGARDLSFGSDGMGQVYLPFNIAGMAVDPAGRIVVGGSTSAGTGSASQWYVSRLNADGTSDAPFNGADPFDQSPSLARTAPGTTLVGIRQDAGWLALQPDGKILLGGFFFGGETEPGALSDPFAQTNSNIELIRFNADGTPDLGFGDGGEAITRNGEWISYDSDHGLFIRPNGQIVIAGVLKPGVESLVGYQAVFDSGGHFLSSGYSGPGGYIQTVAATMMHDGTMVSATEEVYGQTVLDFEGRETPFGLNTPLGTGLYGTTGNVGQISTALGTADSKLLLATGQGDRVAVARVDASGAPDLTFGFGGTSTLVLDPYHDGWTVPQSISALAQTADGEIIVAGSLRGKLYLARLEGGSHAVGQSPPRVSASLIYYDSVSRPSNQPLSLTVRFYGENAIDVSTIDEQDIVVTGPNGYSAVGKFGLQGIMASDGVPVDVSLEIPDPGASAAAAGIYTVHLVGRVADLLGHAAAKGVVGAFALPGGLPANRPPVDSPFEADVLAPYGPVPGQHFMTFEVRFHSAAGIDLTTLDDRNFAVKRGDGISSQAEFVSSQASADGTTVIATYRLGAPSGQSWDDLVQGTYLLLHPEEGSYEIDLTESPLDHAGSTVAQYAGPDIVGAVGKFTNRGNGGTQPVATLDGVDLPNDGEAVRFRVRYTPEPGSGINLSSIADSALSVDPLNSDPAWQPNWAHLEQAVVQGDRSVVATYSVAGNPSAEFLGIHMAMPQNVNETKIGPRDNNDFPVPGGLLGTIDLNYAYRRPSATLLTSQTTASPRRYVSFSVRYASLAGINQTMLDNADVLVTGPDGSVMKMRLEGVVDETDATGVVVSYFLRVPVGATGEYQVTMATKQVRDIFGRRVSEGKLGIINVMVAGVQRRVENGSINPPKPIAPGFAPEGLFAAQRLRLWDENNGAGGV
jgi:uncharacterized delta-60 repeat protein